MNIEVYLAAYEKYRDAVLGMKKAAGAERTAMVYKTFAVGEMIEFVDYEDLEREYEKKKRILSRATQRLQRAISEISDVRLSNYLVCRYLCRMTNEDISEHFNYCPRQIYRISALAKKQLYQHLITKMPLAKRWVKGKHFSYRHKRGRKSFRKYGPRARRRRAANAE